jgi:hypothetical protein
VTLNGATGPAYDVTEGLDSSSALAAIAAMPK